MSALVKKLTVNPAFPVVIAGLSYTTLAVTSAAALYVYFTQIANNDFWHWQLVGYVIMLANAITGYSEFFSDESFCLLRDLLDYFQVALVLPCYAAQMWVKTEMGPPEIGALHAGLGIMTALMFVIMECRRQDLTDLAIFANAFSLLFMAAISVNPFALLATSVLASGYFLYKRDEDQCCLAPQDKFNFVMGAFAVISLISFDDQIVQSLQDVVKSITNNAASIE